MFQMTNVTKAYRTDLLETHALREFSLTVDKGEFVAVTGPSGSGKTTFLNVAGLLESFDSGTYRLDGEDVSKLDDDARSRVRNHKIGFIFQSFNLVPVLDVAENIELPVAVAQKGESAAALRARVRALAERVGLLPYLHHRPDELSGGQRQRVAIARALITNPRLVLADEPTANLDSATSEQILDLMLELNREQGVTFLFSTHDPRVVKHARRALEIRDGKMVDGAAGGH